MRHKRTMPIYETPLAQRILAYLVEKDSMTTDFIAAGLGLKSMDIKATVRSLVGIGKLDVKVVKSSNWYRLPQVRNAIPGRDWAFMKPMSPATLSTLARAGFSRRPVQEIPNAKHL